VPRLGQHWAKLIYVVQKLKFPYVQCSLVSSVNLLRATIYSRAVRWVVRCYVRLPSSCLPAGRRLSEQLQRLLSDAARRHDVRPVWPTDCLSVCLCEINSVSSLSLFQLLLVVTCVGFFACAESCRNRTDKAPFIATQLNSTGGTVGLSCVAIDGA